MSAYKVTGKNGKEVFSEVLLHPGEVLGEELEARENSQKEFAELIEMRPPHLNELIKGKRHISAVLAIKLEKHLNIDAGFWIRLQTDYDLKLACKRLKVA